MKLASGGTLILLAAPDRTVRTIWAVPPDADQTEADSPAVLHWPIGAHDRAR
jgi:hypothetical protein